VKPSVRAGVEEAVDGFTGSFGVFDDLSAITMPKVSVDA